MALLQEYSWPGNVRELENAIERAMVVGRPPELGTADFILTPKAGAGSSAVRTLEDVERLHILKVVEQCGGNQTRAAEVLDIDRVTLHNRLKRYGWMRPTADSK
jgi:two-component system response regulator HydG